MRFSAACSTCCFGAKGFLLVGIPCWWWGLLNRQCGCCTPCQRFYIFSFCEELSWYINRIRYINSISTVYPLCHVFAEDFQATPCFTAAPRGVPKSFGRCSCAKAGSRKPHGRKPKAEGGCDRAFFGSQIFMGMDQYLLIPFLVGWTSIYQLFWCSPGIQGFDPSPYHHSFVGWALYFDPILTIGWEDLKGNRRTSLSLETKTMDLSESGAPTRNCDQFYGECND